MWIWTAITTLFGRLKIYILIAFALLAILFQIYRRGQEAERLNQLVKRLEHMKNAKDLRDEIDNLGSSDLDDRYRRWLRDNPEDSR